MFHATPGPCHFWRDRNTSFSCRGLHLLLKELTEYHSFLLQEVKIEPPLKKRIEIKRQLKQWLEQQGKRFSEERGEGMKAPRLTEKGICRDAARNLAFRALFHKVDVSACSQWRLAEQGPPWLPEIIEIINEIQAPGIDPQPPGILDELAQLREDFQTYWPTPH